MKSMKSLDSQIRHKSFLLDACKRRIGQLEGMIAELKRQSSELKQDLDLEHSRTKISDANHFAYSPLARSLTQRHDNLNRSIRELDAKLENAKAEASEAIDNLNELLQERARREEHANQSTSKDRSAMGGIMASALIV